MQCNITPSGARCTTGPPPRAGAAPVPNACSLHLADGWPATGLPLVHGTSRHCGRIGGPGPDAGSLVGVLATNAEPGVVMLRLGPDRLRSCAATGAWSATGPLYSCWLTSWFNVHGAECAGAWPATGRFKVHWCSCHCRRACGPGGRPVRGTLTWTRISCIGSLPVALLLAPSTRLLVPLALHATWLHATLCKGGPADLKSFAPWPGNSLLLGRRPTHLAVASTHGAIGKDLTSALHALAHQGVVDPSPG